MPESEKKNYKDGSERVAIPANLSKPKLKWKISVEEANRYGLDVLKGIIPFIFIIVMCFEVSNYISDSSEDIVDPNNKGDGENIIIGYNKISGIKTKKFLKKLRHFNISYLNIRFQNFFINELVNSYYEADYIGVPIMKYYYGVVDVYYRISYQIRFI